MYEYEGKTYQGRLKHIGSFDTCTECHNSHGLDVKTKSCMTAFCHGNAGTPQNIRKTQKDFDGDGSMTEGLAGEIDTLGEALLNAMTRLCEGRGRQAASRTTAIRIRTSSTTTTATARWMQARPVQQLDAAIAPSRLQLSVRAEGARRLRPQRQVRDPGAV